MPLPMAGDSSESIWDLETRAEIQAENQTDALSAGAMGSVLHILFLILFIILFHIIPTPTLVLHSFQPYPEYNEIGVDCSEFNLYIYIYVPHHGVIRCSSNRVLEMFGPISQWIFVRWSMFSIFKVWPFPSLAVPVPTPWLNVSPLGLSESWVPQSPLVDNSVQN